MDAPAARCGSSGGGAGVMMNVKSPPHRGRQRRPPARGARRTAAPAPTDDLESNEWDEDIESVNFDDEEDPLAAALRAPI